MHSAHNAVARCPSVRLSVCPSVTRRYSVETAKCVIRLFYNRIVYPLYPTLWLYSDGDPPNGGVECKGDMKNLRQISRVVLEMIQDNAIVTMERQ